MSAHDPVPLGMQNIRALKRYPDRVAFASEDGTLTYRAALDLLGQLQSVLLSLNLRPRSCVAFLCANRADAWLAGVAAQLCGFATTWLHPLGSLDDHIFQIEDTQSGALIVDTDKFSDRGLELAAATSCVEVLFGLGRLESARDLLAEADAAGSVTARSLASPDDPCSIFYSGGTSGRPKGTLRLNRQHGHFALTTLVNFEFPRIPRYLAVGPISHVAGSNILPTLMLGGTVHLARGFDPEAMLKTIERERINLTLAVPTMIYTLLDHPALAHTDTSSLELLLYGAAPMAAGRLMDALDRFGPIFSQLYGQGECYPITVLGKHDHDRTRAELLASCGYPAIGCDVRVVDDDDRDVGVGEPGEICVRAPQAMLEYWQQPDLTKETMRNGWIYTGDIACCDERGYLYIVDRKKDVIVSGGFNIYSREVEDVLATHPDVSMVAVIGLPHEKWGEAATAFVVARPNTAPAEEELIELVRRKKGSLYAPKEVRLVRELPLTAIGKVDKKTLKAPFWAGSGRLVG